MRRGSPGTRLREHPEADLTREEHGVFALLHAGRNRAADPTGPDPSTVLFLFGTVMPVRLLLAFVGMAASPTLGFFLGDIVARYIRITSETASLSFSCGLSALAAALFLRVLYGGALSPLVRLLASAGVMALAYAFFRDYALGFTNLFKGGETIFDLFGA